jgi:hypothetical protein
MRPSFLATGISALAPLVFAASAHAQATQAPLAPLPSPTTPTAPSTDVTAAGAAQPGAVTVTPTAAPSEPAAPPTPAIPPSDTSLQTGTAGARAAGMAPPGSNPNAFMDTRLTWTFGDDDFINRTGVLVPLSPTFNIGDRPQYRLFFDNLNSRFAGRENLTHLVMYKKMPSFVPNLTTEAALALRFDLAALASQSGNLNSALYDAGSYIRIFYKTDSVINAKGTARDAGLSAVFFPLDTDRMRLGYLYDISWGGTDQRINESIFPRAQGSSPGFKLQFDMPDKYYGFVGFKTATIVEQVQILNTTESDSDNVRVAESNYGFLGGGGVDFTNFLRLDVGAGYFQQGKLDFPDVRGKPVYTYGASGRLVLHHDMPVPQSVDFRLYRNDPSSPMLLFAPQKYDANEFSWSISAEASSLRQQLKDVDVSGATKTQAANAAAIQGVVAYGFSRLSLTGIYRDLSFVLRSVPGFIPFTTLPANIKTDPELFGAAAFSYYFDALRLTPELGIGVQLPSTFKSEFANGNTPAVNTIVVRKQGDESIQPLGAGRKAIVQMRLGVKWAVSDILSAVLWGQLVNDNNGTLIIRDPGEGTASLRVYQKPTRLGAGVALQARF